MKQAKWIWKKQQDYNLYNQTIIARKFFNLGKVQHAKIYITADSYYRLFINNEWIIDGPCRSWPGHYQYDEIEVTNFLKTGANEIRVIAKYWGVGTFHNVCQQAGLLAQLDIELENGETQTVITDDSWKIAEAKAWIPETPKASIQMEPQEYYDARLEDDVEFSSATVLFDVDNGPWKDLNPRDVALLTKEPFNFKSFMGANIVERNRDIHFCIPTARLVNPGIIEANHNASNTCGMATIMELTELSQIKFYTEGFRISVNGKINDNLIYNLNAGKHLVLALVTDVIGHQKEKTIRFLNPPLSLKIMNPLDELFENPWCWISFPEYAFTDNDLITYVNDKNFDISALIQKYENEIDDLFKKAKNEDSFKRYLGKRTQKIPSEKMFVRDNYWQFMNRQVIGDANHFIDNSSGLIYNNSQITVVNPSPDGDVELIYDLGEQNCGYYDFDLIADEGVEIDVYGIEYITQDGDIQHTGENRNGMRYITKAGANRFTSLKRRSGRYIFITFRNQKSPLRIQHFQLIESTYPIEQIGNFQCSDDSLDKIWDISARTLKLCMEDTFTDCPLYEQTLWIGDARNEAVFAFSIYGTTDIARRCITLAGQSLEQFPIVGCQVPSSWDFLLPAWSFLWGISVWDYCFYSDDIEFLKKSWHFVIRNLEGAEKLVDENGLFSGPFWNMFDWSGIDDRHKTVLHNSMLLVGAIDAAQKCANVLNDKKHQIWLQNFREKLTISINRYWNNQTNSYVDSIHKDGNFSQSISQHTSFLSILYDIIEKKNFDAAVKNILNPPKDMVKVGSPFAMMYYYEALEKIGREDEIIKSIYESYLPMLEAGATTVWEIFPSSNYRPGKFPTRSHCHAWSSAPLYFLNRIILGVKQMEPGGRAFEIGPRLNGLKWAKGAIATVNGPVHVAWSITGNELHVRIEAPKNVEIQFIENDTHKEFQIKLEIVKKS